MLTSLLFHHPNQPFRIFILVPSSFSEGNRKKIVDSLRQWPHELQFLSVQREPAGLKVHGHVSSAAYYRLYVPELLPTYIKIALYLDSDILINGCILDLLTTDISGHSLAAVPDALVDRNEEIRLKIGLAEKARYLNSGVLLMNLERWRSEKISVRALEFCISNPDLITYWDQCALNHIVQGNYCILDKKWNFQHAHMARKSTYTFFSNALKEASSSSVIHFTTPEKPWFFMCTHPMRKLYFEYLGYTAWRDFVEKDRTPTNILRKYVGVTFPLTSRTLKAFYVFGKQCLMKERGVTAENARGSDT
jgi:lipopolysaccharide biosynthesis glycosyltransferase